MLSLPLQLAFRVLTLGCPYQFGIFPSTAGGCAPTYMKCAFGAAKSVACDLGLVPNVISLFTVITYNFCNKLERLPIRSLSTPV